LDSLLLHFHDPLRQYIVGSISSGEAVGITHDDILQETIIAAIRGIRGLEPRGAEAFFAWLRTIAGNCHRNMIAAALAQKRGEGRAEIEPAASESTATSILGQIASSDPSPSLISRKKEAIEAIARAIAALNPEQRDLIELHYNSRLSV